MTERGGFARLASSCSTAVVDQNAVQLCITLARVDSVNVQGPRIKIVSFARRMSGMMTLVWRGIHLDLILISANLDKEKGAEHVDTWHR